MTYGDRLERWAVVRLLANMQRVTIARFAQESDADGFAQALRCLEPKNRLIVMFDPDRTSESDRSDA